jgi:putative ABC transport system permease protein
LPITLKGRHTVGWNQENRAQQIEGDVHVVRHDYLAAMGMRLVRGRAFSSQDVKTSELVALVNEVFASRFLPSEPFNARLALDLDDRPGQCGPVSGACTSPWRVIGVVSDVRRAGAGAVVQPEISALRGQFLSAAPQMQYLTVRTTGDPAALAPVVRKIVRDASATGVLEQVMTMDARLMLSLARQRLYSILLVGVATFALLIAVIGLYGGLSYAVTQRTREIGVRTALGATPRDIVGLILRQGAVMTLVGVANGLGVAASTGRYLASFLFGVTPEDPAAFVAVGVALTAIAAVACGIPARRAAKVDPIDALRR